MASGSSQSQAEINVTRSSVGVLQTGENCNININRDLNMYNLSQEKFEINFVLPRLITTFKGRETEMQTLDSLFFIQKKNKVVICGMGGLGKSELSKQYAKTCLQTEKIDKVFWINADIKDHLQRSFRYLKRIYKSFAETKSLFIFDNSLCRQDIFNYEPPENNKHFLLITSQEKDWGDDVEILKLNPLSLESAVNVFQSILSTNYKDEEQELYKELAGVVGNIPTGLQITGAYIRQRIKHLRNDFKLDDYITLLKQSQNEFINIKLPTFASNNYEKSIYGAIKISVDKIRDKEDSELRDLALNVLCSCCFLHPSFITYDILLEMRNITEIMATILDKSKLNLAINMLNNYLFLDYSADNKQITIHRSTQEILQCYLGKSESKLQMHSFCSCLDFASLKGTTQWETFTNAVHMLHILPFADNNTNYMLNYFINHLSENLELFDPILHFIVCFGFSKCLFEWFKHIKDYPKQYFINQENFIHLSIQFNQTDTILKLLLQYIDVNSRNEGKNTALHTAASSRNLNAIKILIEHKADTSLRNSEGNTPLFSFIESYREDFNINIEEIMVICELLNCDENKNITNNMQQTLVHVAAAASQEQLIKLLTTKYKMNANEKDLQGRTPSHYIISNTAKYTRHVQGMTEIFRMSDNLLEKINELNNNTMTECWKDIEKYVVNQMKKLYGENIKEFKFFNKKFFSRFINYNLKYNVGNKSFNTITSTIEPIALPFFKANIESLEDDNLIFSISNLIYKIILIIENRIMNGQECSFKTLIPEVILDNINNMKEVIAAAKELITHGALKEIKVYDNKTPLDYALNYKLYYLADIFLFDDNDFVQFSSHFCNFNLNLGDINEHYLLYKAIVCNKLKVLIILLQNGIWNLLSMKLLVESNVDLYATDCNTESILYQFTRSVCCRENIDIEETNEIFNLLKLKENVSILNNDGYSIICIPAALCDNMELLNLLLKHGLDVNIEHESQVSPLHVTAFHWNLPALKFLVQHNASLNAIDKNGETTLFYFIRSACNREDISVNEISEIFDLLKLEENKNSMNIKGHTLMDITAALCRNVELLNLLVQRGFDVNSKNEYQATPIHEGAFHWNLRSIKFLLEHNVDLNDKNCNGDTALFQLVRGANRQESVNVNKLNEIFNILKLEEFKNTTNNNGQTLLYVAANSCQQNAELMLNLLLQSGLKVNSTDNNQNTPLHAAALQWNLDAVRFLVQNNANLNATDSYGETALFNFIRSGFNRKEINVDEINEMLNLLKLKDNRNTTNNKDHTIMYIAASLCYNMELLNLLLQHGLDVNSKNGSQTTPLHGAVLNWNLPAMKFLVEHNADLSATDSNGDTALFTFIRSACNRKDIHVDEINEIFDALKLEANQNTTDINGYTLFYVTAALCQNTELLNLLLQRGFEVNSAANDVHATALHSSAFNWNLTALKFLIAHGANLNAKNIHGHTALFYYIAGAQYHEIINLDEVNEVLEILLINQNKDITSKNNNTLLYSAVISYQPEMVSLLLTKYKMNVNHQDLQGDSPLHDVIIKLDSRGPRSLDDVVRTVEVLKEHGARLDIKNEDAKTPLLIAQEKGAEFLFSLLSETVPNFLFVEDHFL